MSDEVQLPTETSGDSINVSEIEYSLWETELEIALLTKCDYGTIRNIAKCRPIPIELRAKVWQICLNVQDKENLIDQGEPQTFDLPQQQKIREDCQSLVDKLDNNEDEKLAILSNLESIITYYCKTQYVSFFLMKKFSLFVIEF
jgi:TBC1 domain family member 23